MSPRRTFVPCAFVSTIALLCSLVACSSPSREAFTAAEDGGATTTTAPTTPGVGFGDAAVVDAAPTKDECQKLDVIFVVDDSGSMAEKQRKLRENFPRFVDVLDNYKTKGGSDLDYRLAVTSTDTTRADYKTGGKGGFVTAPKTTCTPGPARAWLERTDPTVAAAFGCRAGLGTAGSTDEKPLLALQLALTDREKDQNQAFLRDDALLAFIILTDEEDGSKDDPSPTGLINTLDQRKTLRGRWAGAVISGPATESCNGGSSSTSGGADKAPRLHELVDGSADSASGKNNVIWRTICQDTFDTAVKDALDAFTVACRDLPALPR